MNILLINQDWFAQEWRSEGHQVVVCGHNPNLEVSIPPFVHIETIIKTLPERFTPDRIVVHDNSSPLTVIGLEETEIPSVFYSVDTHHHSELHRALYNVFDQMFVAQKDYIDEFEAHDLKPHWLPLWAPRLVEAETQRKYDAVFVGTMNPQLNPERVEFFERLRSKAPVHCEIGEYWKIFPFSEIVINQTVKGDLNFRVFEAMMCGTLLLTEKSSNGLFELFKDGTHLTTYTKNNVEEAAERISFYLSNRRQAREIAAAGRAEVMVRHRPVHRAAKVMQVLRGLQRTSSDSRYFSAMINYTTLGKTLFQKGYAECINAYIHSMRCLEAGMRRGEKLSEALACFAVITAFSYDRLTNKNMGREMLMYLAEAYPQQQVTQYAKLRLLLDAGKRKEAEAMAVELSCTPVAETFDRAESLCQAVLIGNLPSEPDAK